MRHLPLVAIAIMMVGACKPAKPEGISGLAASVPAAPGAPGVAYFTITSGKQSKNLISITSPEVVSIEMHESILQDGKKVMREMEGGVAIKAGESVEFKPGGKHAMMLDMNPRMKAGSSLPLTFTFADGQVIATQVTLSPPGDAKGHAH